ncbi:snake venom 5'-nucleotidase-like [Saccoglossus kowalevskii]|uniref:5'-nucleotidase n=1 Tax=Saccoglossus kowalevskii TaxID=10224 RepID=A0ABM0H171_SACKO|nr:PREDICTED: 5'-nucleotidase-like [Saccoglossus kowalevskii]
MYSITVLLLISVPLSVALELVILHTNDFHARFPESNKYGGRCSDEDKQEGKCYGGAARFVTKINELKEQHDNVLVLDAGDQFQGTLWFYHYRGDAAARFMQTIGYDAMALGNHEFDNGIDGLLSFLRQVNFPVLSSNIDADNEATMQGQFEKSTVLTLPSGDRIGIVGYTTQDAPTLSSTENLIFNPEVESIRAEVERLKTQGVNKIIALGHAGINKDLDIARMVDGIDIVVGGHTNTFLYTGDPPSNEDPYDTYPIVIHPGDDVTRNVLVVQDYAFGKYLGYLQVTFDTEGDVTEWSGNPILLDDSVEQDAVTLAEIEEWAEPIFNITSDIIGKTHVFLDGQRDHCRLKECNLGNLIADAMVHQNIKHPDETRWNHVSIALMNGGGIRDSVDVAANGVGILTVGDILNIQPFRNTLDLIDITGATLIKVLEWSVSDINPDEPSGRFLQVSGLLVNYDLDAPVGSRVKSLEAKCTECKVPEFIAVDRDSVYTIIVPTFIANGGDGYDMLVDERIRYHIPGDLDSDVLIEYIESQSPITKGLERRITFGDPCNISLASQLKGTFLSVPLFVFLVFLFRD